MKTIEELGISPTPWEACAPTKREVSVVCLKNDKWHSVQDVALCRSDRRNADSHIIAAAPKMYNELWKICFGDSDTINCRKCKGAELGRCSSCPLGGARAALEEASMEVSNG